MLWPALTWRGQERAQHVQGQLLHTCIMQAAGSSLVMGLLTDSIKCMSFTVEAVLNIRAVLRTVLCAVRIKLQKEIIFLRVLLYCMTKSYSLEQFPHPTGCQNPDITLKVNLIKFSPLVLVNLFPVHITHRMAYVIYSSQQLPKYIYHYKQNKAFRGKISKSRST